MQRNMHSPPLLGLSVRFDGLHRLYNKSSLHTLIQTMQLKQHRIDKVYGGVH